MKRFFSVLFAVVFAAGVARAGDFARDVNVEKFEKIAIQHQQTVKTFDTFARQVLTEITGRGSLEGNPATVTVLDMAFRPDAYRNANVIKIKAVPVREVLRDELVRLKVVDQAEATRIYQKGTISLTLWRNPETLKVMRDLVASDTRKAQAVGEVDQAAQTLEMLSANNYPAFRIIPPPRGGSDQQMWHNLGEIAGNVSDFVEYMKARGMTVPPPVPAYSDAQLSRTGQEFAIAVSNWGKDASKVNEHLDALADQLIAVNPERYPSETRRNVEVVYNRLAKFTLPGAAFYFLAFTCFLMSARSHVDGLRLWGIRFFVIAYLIHTLGIGIRWWLVAGQHDSWFYGIPIKNQFESVLMSCWFGATVGLILELRKSKGIFGAAASFVGWMALVAIFSAPYVAGRDIGGEIGQVTGVLMSYWLYIHVTMATASYALIAMSFVLGTWWLIKYYSSYGTFSRVPPRQLSSDVAEKFELVGSGGSAAIEGGFVMTLARVFFFPARAAEPVVSNRSERAARKSARQEESAAVEAPPAILATLDQCNLVVLQLAFWILGTAIVLGAVWADESWGRPWGWDPKETFALVTWIVYLVIVHVRVATENKAWWTAVLSILGFFVMLFNWIGVNFFLVGLHSYA